MSVQRLGTVTGFNSRTDAELQQRGSCANLDRQNLANIGARIEATPFDSDQLAAVVLNVALIDNYQFSRDCLKHAFAGAVPKIDVSAFSTLQDYITKKTVEFDLIIYYAHVAEADETIVANNISSIREALPEIPLVVLSDADDTLQPRFTRRTLRSGVHGVIPTRTTSIPVAIAAIQFIKAGGTFAPLDLLVSCRPERQAPKLDLSRPARLTARQMSVLSYVYQGKANKIIAYELGMSESTVKVHVRNIMRKMGATNRTQVAFKAQKFWDNADLASLSEL